MKKFGLGLVMVLVAIVFSGCLNRQVPGALKVTSQTSATVWVDGKEVGTTPYTNDSLEAGQITLRLASTDTTNPGTWEAAVDVNPGVYTVVNRQLAESTEKSGGEILSMEPTNQSVASVAVITTPNGAMVKVDGQTKGPTPLEIGQIEPGNHQVEITSPGYVDRVIPISTEVGYKLIINAQLVKKDVDEIVTDLENPDESTDSADTEGDVDEEEEEETPSATPTSTASNDDNDSVAIDGAYVVILDTPTGWLRVRAEASTGSEEVGRVEPGKEYPLLDESNGWYQIEYETGEEGWVAGQYAEKHEE